MTAVRRRAVSTRAQTGADRTRPTRTALAELGPQERNQQRAAVGPQQCEQQQLGDTGRDLPVGGEAVTAAEVTAVAALVFAVVVASVFAAE
ncbi:hypothetical protein KBZ21_11065, partial [Streptomyces sp. A73]|nr:hypothetical protein [Streptomyces sp. A73]